MVTRALPVEPPAGLSVIEADLYRHLREHVQAEGDLLADYKRLADSAQTPAAARFVMGLILSDEERHHRLMDQLAASVGDGVAWPHDPDSLPPLPYGRIDPELLEATDRLIAAERADRQELRRLRRELRPYRDTSLWSLLVEVMEAETDKHIRLLTFVRDHIARPSTG